MVQILTTFSPNAARASAPEERDTAFGGKDLKVSHSRGWYFDLLCKAPHSDGPFLFDSTR